MVCHKLSVPVRMRVGFVVTGEQPFDHVCEVPLSPRPVSQVQSGPGA